MSPDQVRADTVLMEMARDQVQGHGCLGIDPDCGSFV
jgi:hypothetical protein